MIPARTQIVITTVKLVVHDDNRRNWVDRGNDVLVVD